MFNPLTIYQDYYDYYGGGDFPGDGSYSIFFRRAFVILEVFLVNLTIGCLLTLLLFQLRRCIGNYCLCCCEDCDCENDGNGRTRLPSKVNRRGRERSDERKKGRDKDDEGEKGCCLCEALFGVVCYVYTGFKGLSRCQKAWMSRIGIFLGGAAIAYFVIHIGGPRIGDQTGVKTLVYGFSHKEVLTGRGEEEGDKRVFFITPTAKSGVQVARLTRLAQALYQNRDFVTWVVVSTDPVLVELWNKKQLEHWNERQIQRWKSNETFVMNHLGELKETLDRFGIPFVLLSGHEIHHKNSEFTKSKEPLLSTSPFMKASQIGMAWVTKFFSDGVFFVGIEDAAYNFKLFREVRETSFISSWPTAFDKRYVVGLQTPILYKRSNTIRGYFLGGSKKLYELPLEYGTFAVHVRLARELRSSDSLWKLASDVTYSTNDLGISLVDVQALGNNCTEIYVWKLNTHFMFARVINKQRIIVQPNLTQTNIPRLVKKVRTTFALDLRQESTQ